jgi:uncharacterized phage protein gp47/JayE
VEGQVGNVSNGSINLVAQAGIDSVADSILVEVGADREEDGPYRERILLRKQNENRGGTPDDWKNWAESVEGVISATVFPRNRGNGTVDVLVAGQNGFPDQVLIDKVQEYLDSKTPADIADGGVLVVAPTGVTVDVTLSNCVWREGYDSTSGAPIVESTIKEYINKQANLDRVIRVTRLINIASSAYDPVDSDKRPILLDFSMLGPKENHILANTEMSLPGSILLS